MSETIVSPFHPGEQKIQHRLGVRDYMPDQHREFYAQLPFVFVAHADQHGWPWSSILFNQPGFIDSPDNKHIHINAIPVPGDPLINLE